MWLTSSGGCQHCTHWGMHEAFETLMFEEKPSITLNAHQMQHGGKYCMPESTALLCLAHLEGWD